MLDTMDYILIAIALFLSVIGFIGAVVPGIPGPPLNFLGLLLLSFCDNNEVALSSLIVSGLLAVVVTVVDYIAPIWFAKRAGGTKAGVTGATIGLIVGLFFGFVGVLLGPFLGALIGELSVRTSAQDSLRVAFMSFLAFLATTGVKIAYSVILTIMIIKESFGLIWN